MSGEVPRDALIRDLAIVLAGALDHRSQILPGPHLAARRMQDVLGFPDRTLPSKIEALLRGVLVDDEGCGCPFDYPYTCPSCGHSRITNHCPHDGVQNACPECGWTDPGKETPLQFLGVTRPPGADEGGQR